MTNIKLLKIVIFCVFIYEITIWFWIKIKLEEIKLKIYPT